MKKLLALALCCVAIPAFAVEINEHSPIEQQTGYSFGYVLGTSQSTSIAEYDLPSVLKGVEDAAQGKPASLSKERMLELLVQHRKEQESKPLIEMQQQALQNEKNSKAFFAQNGRKAGVKTTRSGLQFQVLRANLALGEAYPRLDSTVKVHYEGRSIDGTVFDSSIARDEPAVFKVNQLIAGLQEGLKMMKPNQKARFFIPAELAYGAIGAGTTVQPNQAVIFDIELLEIVQ